MSAERIDTLLRTFRRQLAKTRVLQIGVILLLVAVIPGGWWWPAPLDKGTGLLALAGVLLLWVGLALGSMRLGHALQTGRALLSVGQLDDAEIWLRRAMTGLSLSPGTPFMACHYMASVFAQRGAYAGVELICRELLRHRLKRLGHVWVNTRLLLADSLLNLDRADEVYEAVRPLHDIDLSLADRMKLLPIQLRYELASDHSAWAAGALADKVRIAELLDGPRAALVHALLAEACRREAMTAQHHFLAERARLYWNLGELAERYAIIAPIAADGH